MTSASSKDRAVWAGGGLGSDRGLGGQAFGGQTFEPGAEIDHFPGGQVTLKPLEEFLDQGMAFSFPVPPLTLVENLLAITPDGGQAEGNAAPQGRTGDGGDQAQLFGIP